MVSFTIDLAGIEEHYSFADIGKIVLDLKVIKACGIAEFRGHVPNYVKDGIF